MTAARWLAALLLAAPVAAAAQQLPALGADLAFRADFVESIAASAYRQRLAQLAEQSGLDLDRPLLERIRRAARRLLLAAERERTGAERLDWEFHLCRRCGENASAMAGGKLLFGEEFVAGLALSDDELGYLVAHEMAHVLCEHTREFATAGRYFISNGLRRDYEDVQAELDRSLPVQLSMAFLSSQQELEADRVGFTLGALAGFDPDAMMSLLRKLAGSEPGFASSHPSAERRLREAAQMLDAARRLQHRVRP